MDLVERYCKEQGLFRTAGSPTPGVHRAPGAGPGDHRAQPGRTTRGPRIAWPWGRSGRTSAPPSRPSSRVRQASATLGEAAASGVTQPPALVKIDDEEVALNHGSVAIAAITSCTNTSNPSVMLAAGLLAKHAVERGLMVNPAVKTSLAPGSRAVTDYLDSCRA